MFLSLQLPITIFLQLYMTSSRKVMGQYANHTYTNVLLWGIGIVVTVMNIYLLIVGNRKDRVSDQLFYKIIII